ncbi:Cof-type HAD-IIB family hydrolase [Paenibacillus yanchengensis]|uniref:Cof-type HAD-IIB family hydrolase n=1 Tax=Paenibacillus yanchengensis TaxID=2035833 RepID=A0ABW4YPZ3_9BACL
MTKYKLMALDMDGTLLNEWSEISDENAIWIHKAQAAGVTVCFSTGRGFMSANPYAHQLQLVTPMITVNGSEVWSKPHELLKRTEMDVAMIAQLHQLAGEYPDAWFWAYTTEGIYNKEKWIGKQRKLEDYTWLKFGFHTENDKERAEITEELIKWDAFEITNSSIWNIELNPKGVNKAAAIQEVCKFLNIDISEVIAVGDSLNDIAAIQACGLGIAMGNAQQEVKDAADEITVTNNEDAIAAIIKKHIFGQ